MRFPDRFPAGASSASGLRDPQTVAFEIYQDRKRQHLVATIGDPEPALYRSSDPFAIDPGLVTPFALLLRKYVRGATLLGVEQPPLERIVRLSIAKRFWPHNRADDESDAEDEQEDEEAAGLASGDRRSRSSSSSSWDGGAMSSLSIEMAPSWIASNASPRR